MKFFRVALAALLLSSAALAQAQAPLRLQITNGRVTLHAAAVPVRTILAEWARVGGSKIVNAERVAGSPLTLDLEGVPERQALDIILRGVSGYVVAAREPGTSGASMYDRIMILPTSVAPRNPAPAAPAPVFQGAPNGIVRPIVPRQTAADDQDGNDDSDVPQINPVTPVPNDGVPLGRPLPRPAIPGVPVTTPVMPPVVVPDAEPQPQQPTNVAPTPTNPFGLPAGSSLRPGVITPVPQGPQPVPQGGVRPQD